MILGGLTLPVVGQEWRQVADHLGLHLELRPTFFLELKLEGNFLLTIGGICFTVCVRVRITCLHWVPLEKEVKEIKWKRKCGGEENGGLEQQAPNPGQWAGSIACCDLSPR